MPRSFFFNQSLEMNNYKLIEYKSETLLRDLTCSLPPRSLGEPNCLLFLSLVNYSVSTKLYLEEFCLLGHDAAWSVECQPPVTPDFVLVPCSPYT
jgi:hypothetical protein